MPRLFAGAPSGRPGAGIVAPRFSTAFETAVQIAGADLLLNDSDVDGDGLNILSATGVTGGQASFANGVVTFTPDEGFSGTGTFEYVVSDGNATATATVSVAVGESQNVVPSGQEITGTAGNDSFTLAQTSEEFTGIVFIASDGDDTYDFTNVSPRVFGVVDYSSLGVGGIVATIDANALTSEVDKGTSGIDSILNVQTVANWSFSIVGTPGSLRL